MLPKGLGITVLEDRVYKRRKLPRAENSIALLSPSQEFRKALASTYLWGTISKQGHAFPCVSAMATDLGEAESNRAATDPERVWLWWALSTWSSQPAWLKHYWDYIVHLTSLLPDLASTFFLSQMLVPDQHPAHQFYLSICFQRMQSVTEGEDSRATANLNLAWIIVWMMVQFFEVRTTEKSRLSVWMYGVDIVCLTMLGWRWLFDVQIGIWRQSSICFWTSREK